MYDVLRAYAGCNELSGTVDRTRTELTSPGSSTTDHACTGETAEVETAILTTLRAKVTYTIDYNRLTLLTPAGTGLDLTAVR
ncbi:META domain-containing protein [Kribbella sp. NBC_01510]|uniref:META domain-containing protein n=1 Tax=Kribbella sp. NBC_01510 TaxID=2903581 RepID=UPI003869AEE8